MPDSNNIVWDAARSYAKAGIYVNPVYVTRKPNGKKDVRPIGLWRTTSSTSLADIGAWEQEHPDAQLLIDTGKSGIVVVDCDGQEGTTNWLDLLAGKLEACLPLAVADTPGGGQHWYYWAHPDHPIGNDQDGKVAPSVDIRGLGGFVFAPPSSDGTGQWRWGPGDEPDWTARDRVVPDVVVGRMLSSRSAPAPEPTPENQDLFDEPDKRFTREQAIAYINDEGKKLKAATSGLNGKINNFAMACAHFPWLIDQDRCAELMMRWLGRRMGWDAPDRDDIATINSAYSATTRGKSWVATEAPQSTPVAGSGPEAGDETTGGTLPSPAQPMLVARELVTRMPATDGTPHWTYWRGDFYRWSGAHWDIAEEAVMRHWLYQQTADATHLVPNKDGGYDPAPWAPTRKKIADLTDALGVGTIQRFGSEDKALAVANGVVTDRALEPHRPDRFNLFSMPFAYDPAAGAPGWEAFLETVLPGDQQAKDFLGEWFGYVLSGRTDQQKMAALIGEKRSGKGTIARVLSALVGRANVTGLSLNLLPGTFGMEPLVGKALGIAGDVRWASRNIADAVPILLGVIGEDAVSVHRKNKSAWEGTLGVRFMLMSNDTPTFSDKSGALGGRMVFVRFDQSFYGREDISLTDKLIGELPGIFNWALDGLDRLNGCGRFTEPDSGAGERDAQRRLADPVGAFLEDWCELGPSESIELDHLFLKYQSWCIEEGRTRDSTTKEIFSRDLRTRVPGLVVDRNRVNGKRTRILRGVGSNAL